MRSHMKARVCSTNSRFPRTTALVVCAAYTAVVGLCRTSYLPLLFRETTNYCCIPGIAVDNLCWNELVANDIGCSCEVPFGRNTKLGTLLDKRLDKLGKKNHRFPKIKLSVSAAAESGNVPIPSRHTKYLWFFFQGKPYIFLFYTGYLFLICAALKKLPPNRRFFNVGARRRYVSHDFKRPSVRVACAFT